ncbi:hypothetical protein J3E68DRAFT_423747 [Trichoderma sp. SZMC 28012]
MAPKAASATTPDAGAGTSAKPVGTWDNIALLNDLLVAFYQVGNQAGNFNTQTNEAVVAFMTAQGHVTSWSAIRPVIPTISATFYTLSIFTNYLHHLHYLSTAIIFLSHPCANFLASYNLSSPFQHYPSLPTNIICSTKNGFFPPVDEVDPPSSRGYPRIRVLQPDPIHRGLGKGDERSQGDGLHLF